jgi:hypothetical protein
VHCNKEYFEVVSKPRHKRTGPILSASGGLVSKIETIVDLKKGSMLNNTLLLQCAYPNSEKTRTKEGYTVQGLSILDCGLRI